MITYAYECDKIQYRAHLFHEGEICVCVCVCVCVWTLERKTSVGVQFKPLPCITNINGKANLILTWYSSQLSHNL
jgi:hypothetical protein